MPLTRLLRQQRQLPKLLPSKKCSDRSHTIPRPPSYGWGIFLPYQRSDVMPIKQLKRILRFTTIVYHMNIAIWGFGMILIYGLAGTIDQSPPSTDTSSIMIQMMYIMVISVAAFLFSFFLQEFNEELQRIINYRINKMIHKKKICNKNSRTNGSAEKSISSKIS